MIEIYSKLEKLPDYLEKVLNYYDDWKFIIVTNKFKNKDLCSNLTNFIIENYQCIDYSYINDDDLHIYIIF